MRRKSVREIQNTLTSRSIQERIVVLSSSNSTPADATEEEEQKIISSSSSSKKRRFSQDDDEDEGKDLCVFTPGPLESDFRCSYSNQQLKEANGNLDKNCKVSFFRIPETKICISRPLLKYTSTIILTLLFYFFFVSIMLALLVMMDLRWKQSKKKKCRCPVHG